MASTVIDLGQDIASSRSLERTAASGPVVVSALTALALAVHGYHPWTEDGGLYAAGIKHLLNPRLYPHGTAFATEHLRFSLFAPFIAALTRIAHLPLDWALFLVYCACIWVTLYTAWMLAGRCFRSTHAEYGAVALLACWLTLPLAGTSLMLMDPYVTARSLSTPLTLLALCWALDGMTEQRPRPWLFCLGSFLLAALLHPLMAGYGIASVLLLAWAGVQSRVLRVWGFVAFGLAAFLLALNIERHTPPETNDYIRVAITRYYWFPGQWKWYELFGLVAPIAIVGAMLTRKKSGDGYKAILRMTIALGLIALFVAATFSRMSLSTHAVARLQPLRAFQTVYIVMILFLGATLGEYLLKRSVWRWVLLVVVASTPVYIAQRNIFPASMHLELPWRAPTNPWVQAFLWAREHTPNDALFAIDPNYITTEGEDAQSFRAIAERSVLPDYSKDGGEASITPRLTAAWIEGQRLQANIEGESDDLRRAALRPAGVDWIILPTASATTFDCPYRNEAVKICRLR